VIAPCAYCVQRKFTAPCIKRWGPKREEVLRLQVSHQIPTALDAVIDSADVLLLQYSYSKEITPTIITAWIKRLAREYGPALSQSAFRNAVLTVSVRELRESDAPRFYNKFELLKGRTLFALRSKLNDPSSIAETDVFASFLLAWLAKEDGSPNEEVVAHIRGCLNMLKYVSEQPRLSLTSNMLKVFGPFVAETARFTYALLKPPRDGMPLLLRHQTTFKQQVQYFEELPSSDASACRAAYRTLISLLQSAITCIRVVIWGMRVGNLNRHPSVEETLDEIKAEFKDPEFVASLDCLLENCTSHYQPPRELLACLGLLVAVLEAATLVEGFDDPEAKHLASILVSSLRYGTRHQYYTENEIYTKSRFYRTCIRCGTLALAEQQYSERK